jgi:hypothetical protein
MFALVVQMNMNIPKLIMPDFQERGGSLPTFTTELLVSSKKVKKVKLSL